MYEKTVLQDIKKTLNESIHASISEKSTERVEKIWNDYENGISRFVLIVSEVYFYF